MAVSPLDPQSVRLTIASDMTNRLSMLLVVHTQMGGRGDNTIDNRAYTIYDNTEWSAEVVLLK